MYSVIYKVVMKIDLHIRPSPQCILCIATYIFITRQLSKVCAHSTRTLWNVGHSLRVVSRLPVISKTCWRACGRKNARARMRIAYARHLHKWHTPDLIIHCWRVCVLLLLLLRAKVTPFESIELMAFRVCGHVQKKSRRNARQLWWVRGSSRMWLG